MQSRHFPDKRKPGAFMTSGPSLKEILKEEFQEKKKNPLKAENPSEETVSK